MAGLGRLGYYRALGIEPRPSSVSDGDFHQVVLSAYMKCCVAEPERNDTWNLIMTVLMRPDFETWYLRIHGGPDLYSVLDVPCTADVEVIRRQFKQLAKALHPDRRKNPDEDNKWLKIQIDEDMKRVNRAHEVLTNNRAAYDAAGKPYDLLANGRAADDENVSDPEQDEPFQQKPKRKRKRANTNKNSIQKVNIVVPLTDLYKGTTRDIRYKRGVRLPDDTWTSYDLVTRIVIPARTSPGHFATRVVAGEYCESIGRMADVHFYAVLPDDPCMYRVEGLNIGVDVDVSLTDMVCGGGTYFVAFPDAPTDYKEMKLTRKVHHGSKIVLQGQGFRDPNEPGVFGDLVCTVRVIVPEMRGPRVAKAFRVAIDALLSNDIFVSETMATNILGTEQDPDQLAF